MSDHRTLPVPEGLTGERLDAALARLFGLSRTAAAELVTGGRVLVDGADAVKSTRVSGGQWLDVDLPPPPVPARTEPEAVPGMRILHDDEHILVLDKPIGVAVHAAPGWTGPTVVGALAAAGYQLTLAGAAERQGIVHRLDAGTSGVMVVARSERAYAALKRAFRDREVDKTYHALVQGHPDPLRGTVDAPLDRHPRDEYKWAVVEAGKPSVTHYDTIEAFRYATLLEVALETGRTHQIRVHMSAIKHPCVGDLMYGADPVLAQRLGLARQWLHAMRLGFVHPASRRRVEFESTYPDDLQRALDTVTGDS